MLKSIYITATLIIFFQWNVCCAEYRVYQYHIKNINSINEGNNSYTEKSTLDPVTYLAYHGGGNSIEIDLLRSWICKGYTAKKQLCRSPLELALEVAQVKTGELE